MIFLDANCFLRWLVSPGTEADVPKSRMAAALFRSIDSGEVEAMTSESILAEVAFVLTAKRHYDVPVGTAADYLSAAIQLRGMRFTPEQKRHYLRALELWRARPALGFVDSLTAAVVEDADHLLATFDSHFDDFKAIRWWRPGNGHQGAGDLPGP